MRRRLRKKKRLGEFKEFCFQVDLTIEQINKEDLHKFVDDLIDFVESKDAFMGGGINSFITYLDKQSSISLDKRIYRTLAYRDELVSWLKTHPFVIQVNAQSDLKDLWNED